MPGGMDRDIFLRTKADVNLGIHPPLATIVAWGKIANPLHPSETRGWELVILVIILAILTTITVIARLWARFRIQHNAGIDDILIVAAMVCSSLTRGRLLSILKRGIIDSYYWTGPCYSTR
jgi:hypothetical protein